MIEILCDDFTSCKEACDNNDYHRSRQRQMFNMSVKSMRNSLDHFIYCIKLSFLFVALYMHRIRKCVQKVIDNIYKNRPLA